jgi:hypothetical protein
MRAGDILHLVVAGAIVLTTAITQSGCCILAAMTGYGGGGLCNLGSGTNTDTDTDTGGTNGGGRPFECDPCTDARSCWDNAYCQVADCCTFGTALAGGAPAPEVPLPGDRSRDGAHLVRLPDRADLRMVEGSAPPRPARLLAGLQGLLLPGAIASLGITAGAAKDGPCECTTYACLDAWAQAHLECNSATELHCGGSYRETIVMDDSCAPRHPFPASFVPTLVGDPCACDDQDCLAAWSLENLPCGSTYGLYCGGAFVERLTSPDPHCARER